MEPKVIHSARTASHRSAAVDAAREQDHDLAVVAEVREALSQAGDYLVYDDGDQLRVIALIGDWTRIGRSTAADVRFDDPTVSRRHALIVRDQDGLQLLDDRSLNGVLVAGERIDRHRLSDGDLFIVGRYRMHFVSIAVGVAGREPAAPSSLQA